MNKTNGKNIYNENGFTLIEILIAITVLSLLMLGIIAFTQNAQDTSVRVTREDKELLQIETAVSRLEWDFSQIYSPLYFSHPMNPEEMSEEEGQIYNQLITEYQSNVRFSKLSFDGLPIPVFQTPEKTSFIFFTSSNRRKFEDMKQSHFAWVSYSLASDDKKPAEEPSIDEREKPKNTMILVRKYYTENVFDKNEIDWSKVKEQVLLRKVTKLKFEFWNPETFKWTENIDTIKDGHHIIYALRVTIEYYDMDNLPKISVRVLRPLFPEFKPENMYKYLNENTKKKKEAEEGNLE
ncbi:MAG: prepilin-type N-terminal cleavage/methylation domain-containing protein [Halobacteriovoraceae bacterium]|jgi:prepilin-type N-terminal cleavage/methylation domain-containing protein|nr:prepilin-type N-terminal cleavage/methylation domain-containing protein [Halobacteriovoraceae bacterium]